MELARVAVGRGVAISGTERVKRTVLVPLPPNSLSLTMQPLAAIVAAANKTNTLMFIFIAAIFLPVLSVSLRREWNSMYVDFLSPFIEWKYMCIHFHSMFWEWNYVRV